jgi:hypothetical protein
MSATSLHSAATAAKPIRPPAFPQTRRMLIRLRAAQLTRELIDELTDRPEPRHGHRPTFARLDQLTERYAALGGDPSDLLVRRRTFGTGPFSALRGALRARRDDWIRRELDAAQTARAHRREIGGDFTIAP